MQVRKMRLFIVLVLLQCLYSIVAAAVNSTDVLIVIGTRPEAIKLVPVIRDLQSRSSLSVSVITTGQHTHILESLLKELGVNLSSHRKTSALIAGQTLDQLFSRCMQLVTKEIRSVSPRLVIVQGDTTTALAAAHAAFYLGVPVAHVEAGLRTNHLDAPYPEEFNRRSVAVTACLHFAPTERSRAALLTEGVSSKQIWVTGNTVIDAAQHFASQPIPDETTKFFADNKLSFLIREKRSSPLIQVALFTCHRRENHGELDGIINAIQTLLKDNPNLHILLPVHPNPNVRTRFQSSFSGVARMYLLPPFSYGTTITVLKSVADIVITDSGGLQEEATSFHVPVIVMREVTERPEGVELGVARIVGTNPQKILSMANAILQNTNGIRDSMVRPDRWPYGDGHAAARIGDVVEKFIGNSKSESPVVTMGSVKGLGRCAEVSEYPDLPIGWRRSEKHYGGVCRVDPDLDDVTAFYMITAVDHPFSAMWFENFELLMPCYRRMVIVMLREDMDKISYAMPPYAEIIPLDIPAFLAYNQTHPTKSDRYFYQMYVKFTADRLLKPEDTKILFVEADAIFVRPAASDCFYVQNKIRSLGTDSLDMWTKGTQFALGQDVKLPFKYLVRETPVLLHKHTLVAARAHIEKLHKMTLEDFLRVHCRKDFEHWSPDNIMFSEFNTLASYATVFQPDLYIPLADAKKYCGHHFAADYAKRDPVHGKLTSYFVLQVHSWTSEALCYLPPDTPSMIPIPKKCRQSTST